MVELKLSNCSVRDLRMADDESMAECANDRRIWCQLRDRFPYPYSAADASSFLAAVVGHDPPICLAIALNDRVIGTIGLEPLSDVQRCGAELGYWLGVSYWGRGIATEAIRAVTQWGMRRFSLQRVFAQPFADNVASCRALQKAGFALEGTMRHSAIKDGIVRDQRLYAYVR